MDLPPSNHFIYIPVMLILGLILGFIMGAKSTREAIRIDQERALARAKRKADRAEQKAAGPADSASTDAPPLTTSNKKETPS